LLAVILHPVILERASAMQWLNTGPTEDFFGPGLAVKSVNFLAASAPFG
ncbi:hypothetical protein G3W53_29030, partial [Escherichia coli]|nr:hypothetical protein [Escherichia coli]